MQADKVAELDSSALGTGNYIPVIEKPAHAHASKLIGDKFPESGYGPSVQLPLESPFPLIWPITMPR